MAQIQIQIKVFFFLKVKILVILNLPWKLLRQIKWICSHIQALVVTRGTDLV